MGLPNLTLPKTRLANRTVGLILAGIIGAILILATVHHHTTPPTGYNVATYSYKSPGNPYFNGRRWKSLVHFGRSRPKIAKLSMVNGQLAAGFAKAMETHIVHAEIHGYPTYLFTEKIMDGMWTKPAAILETLLSELSKDPKESLEWLMWVDADTVVMDNQIPMEIFLPPESRTDVHLIYTNDWNGFNNGVFFLRVSEWSVNLMSSIIAYPIYEPGRELIHEDQMAMDLVLKMDHFKSGAVAVPIIWFNAYTKNDPFRKSDIQYKHEPGRFLIHFAGVSGKLGHMQASLESLEDHRDKWEVPLPRTHYIDEISRFWEENGAARKKAAADAAAGIKE